MEGDSRMQAQSAINLILETTEKKTYFLPIYKDILDEILARFKSMSRREPGYALTN